MKSLITVSLFLAVLSFCGLSEKVKNLSTGESRGNAQSNSSSGSSATGSSKVEPEKPVLSSAQQAVIDTGDPIEWVEQGLRWTMPPNWKKMDVKKETFNYTSPDNAFLLVNVTSMPDNFPADQSINAYYEQAMQQLKAGKYQSVRLLELDGIPGVEFVESPPESKDDSRRHQWIGYRTYLGQQQMLNVMATTRGSNFAKHQDDFTAVLYSLKAVK